MSGDDDNRFSTANMYVEKAFDTLTTAMFRNNMEQIELFFKRDDIQELLKMPSMNFDDRPPFHFFCGRNEMARPKDFKRLFEAIREIGNDDYLKEQLAQTVGGTSALCVLCANQYNYALEENFQLMVETIILLGDVEFLRESLLCKSEADGKTCLSFACENSRSVTTEMMTVLCSLLFHVDLFQETYNALDEELKQKLKNDHGIDSADWKPSPEDLADVEGRFDNEGKSTKFHQKHLFLPKQEAFDVMDSAISFNEFETFDKFLQREDANELLGMEDSNGYTLLAHACRECSTISFDLFRNIIMEIASLRSETSLKEQLGQLYSRKKWNCLMSVCRFTGCVTDTPSFVNFILNVSGTMGGFGFLVESFETKDKSGDKNAFSIACSNDVMSAEDLLNICRYLYVLGIFKKQYAELDDECKKRLKNLNPQQRLELVDAHEERLNIDSEDWTPSETSISTIRMIVGTAEEFEAKQQSDREWARKAEEEAKRFPKQEHFESLVEMMKTNDRDGIMKLLQRDDDGAKKLLETKDEKSNLCLLLVATDSSALSQFVSDTYEMVVRAMKGACSVKNLKQQLTDRSAADDTFLSNVCRSSHYVAPLKMACKLILEVGGPSFLREQLMFETEEFSGEVRTLLSLLCRNFNIHDEGALQFFCAFLHHFDLLQSRYESLQPDHKEDLRKAGIESADWKPDANVEKEVNKLLHIARLPGCDENTADGSGDDVPQEVQTRIEKMFGIFDADGSGFLEGTEIIAAMTTLFPHHSTITILELVGRADVNKDKKLSIKEFTSVAKDVMSSE